MKVPSISKVTGKPAEQVVGIAVENAMSIVGEPSKQSNRRSIVIEKDRFLSNIDPVEAFEAVVDKIAKLIVVKREEVENALIATGSDKSIRKADRKVLNKEVQNRLTENNGNGLAFRQMITALLGDVYGKSLVNDGFFRNGTETKIGSTGQVQAELSGVPSFSGSSTLPLKKTDDGGVKKEGSQQDWGAILQGSSQVIQSIGGVIGLFTGGQQTQAGQSVFDQYNTGTEQFRQAEEANQKRQRNTWFAIMGIIALFAIVWAVMYFSKKQKPA